MFMKTIQGHKFIFLISLFIIFLLVFTNVHIFFTQNHILCTGQETQKPSLAIYRIDDGFNLKYQLVNKGDHDITDISLHLDVIEGSFLKLIKKDFHIQRLQKDTTTTITVPLFGFSLGLSQLYPMITATVFAEERIQDQQGIIIRVIGPLTMIVGDYFNTPLAYQGITLFAPEYSNDAYLLDNSGSIVHHWECQFIQGLAVYLLENGNLVRSNLPGVNPRFTSGGMSGRVEIYDWNSSLQFRFDYFNESVCLHHDVEPLPNGNILMIAWEYKTKAEAIAQGRNPMTLRDDQLWPDHIIEVKPIDTYTSEIVWEWHAWDHLIQEYDSSKPNYGNVKDHPEKIDINYGNDHADWLHINSIDYHEELDQILLSVHNFNEIWVIDHSTTTEEAAGHSGGRYGKGGDLLYRWGNPQTYNRGQKQDQQLFGQHDAQWIQEGYPGEGNIIIFNNGGNQRPFSSIDEIFPPMNHTGFYFTNENHRYGPETPLWTYATENPREFYANHISGCERLPNGNTLICHGPAGYFFEVTKNKQTVWSYTNQYPDLFNNHVFKIRRYSYDYPGLQQLFDE